MSSIKVDRLRDDLSFGSRGEEMTVASFADETIRARLNTLVEDHGLTVFAGCALSVQAS